MAEATQSPLVIIAVDHSSRAVQALNYYIENIHRKSFRILLVHVIELPDQTHARQAYLSPYALSELWNEELVKSKTLEEKLTEILKSHEITDVKMRAEGGMKPGQVICSVAAEEKAVMVVIGTRGMGKFRRTILGSVSDFVVHHSACPVVVCRQAKEEEQEEQEDQ